MRDTQTKRVAKVKTNVTEQTIKRRRRREFKMLMKQEKIRRLEIKREGSHQTKTKIKVELVEATTKN